MKIRIVNYGNHCTHFPFEYNPGYVFVGKECSDYDWLVVYDETREPIDLSCSPQHTILATTEPTSIKNYSQAYVRQFAYFLTNRPFEAERHPGYRLGRGYYGWYLDRSYTEASNLVLPSKSRLVSAVCSSKRMRHTEHDARYRLVEHLSKAMPELEWFGRGVRGFKMKYEVLDPYKYTVVIENHLAPHHWTEKLSDAFLAECLPFYAGDPALEECFPPDSFIRIPLHDPVAAAAIIKQAIENGEYEKRKDAVLKAKRLILEKYNLWQQIIDIIDNSGAGDAHGLALPRRILPRRALRWRPSVAWEDLVHHLRRFGRILVKRLQHEK